MRPNVLIVVSLLTLAACGEDRKSADTLDSSQIRTGQAAGAAEGADAATTSTATTAPSADGAPTEADVKAFVERKAKMLATGIGSAHSDVTVEFQSVEIAGGREVNQQDRLDGVRGDTAWPVRVHWIEHRRWGAGSTEDAPHSFSYDFYRDAFGNWDALGHGPVT